MTKTVSEQKSLKQMLNEAGYKKHSSINPLILQSKVIKIVKEWLKEHQEQPLIRNTKTTDEAELNYTAGQLTILRKLWEDVE